MAGVPTNARKPMGGRIARVEEAVERLIVSNTDERSG